MSPDEKDTQSTWPAKRHHGKKDTKQKEHRNVWELREVENNEFSQLNKSNTSIEQNPISFCICDKFLKQKLQMNICLKILM
jgi:hypothetical protein